MPFTEELLVIPFAESFDNTNTMATMNHRIMLDLNDADDFPPLARDAEWQMVYRPPNQEQSTSHQYGDWIHINHPQRTFAQVATSCGTLHQPVVKSRFLCGLEHQTRKHIGVITKKKGTLASHKMHNNEETIPDFDLLYMVRKGSTAIKRRRTKKDQQRKFKFEETLLKPYAYRRAIKKHQSKIAARLELYEAQLAEAEKHEMKQTQRRKRLERCTYMLDLTPDREHYLRTLAHEIKAHDQKARIYSKCDTDEKVVDLYRKRLREVVLKLPPSQAHRQVWYYYLFPERYHSLYYGYISPHRRHPDYLDGRDYHMMLKECLLAKELIPAQRSVEQYKSIISDLKNGSIRYAVCALPKNFPSNRLKMSRIQYAKAFIANVG
ncbi:hypothetical protein K492DRAFT_233147 [Lichtheimia hyalospora FSU 10163]|nr:hypothetical protein K492DRAFT_233147 [Lichtheimia hyalospora FSU 10163]